MKNRLCHAIGLRLLPCAILALLATLPAVAQDALYVSPTGDIGIGTSTPASILDIVAGHITLGGHTFGERAAVPADLQFSGLRNIIYNIDSDNNSTNASFSVSRDGNPNAVTFVTREDGRTGINIQFPSHPLHVGTNSSNGNGAHLTAAGVWTNASTRASKTNISALSGHDALATLAGLEPVRYAAKTDPDGEEYVGFIAEDVPDLVSMNDRSGISAMDIVAVLTKVAKEQQRALESQLEINRSLEVRLLELEARLGALATN